MHTHSNYTPTTMSPLSRVRATLALRRGVERPLLALRPLGADDLVDVGGRPRGAAAVEEDAVRADLPLLHLRVAPHEARHRAGAVVAAAFIAAAGSICYDLVPFSLPLLHKIVGFSRHGEGLEPVV